MEKYEERGIDVEEGATILKFEHKGRKLRASSQDIRDYKDYLEANKAAEVSKLPETCSIRIDFRYREQAIESLSSRQNYYGTYRMFKAEIGNSDTPGIYASVGPPSSHFINFFRFRNSYFENTEAFLEKSLIWRSYSRHEGYEDIRDFMDHPPTIQIWRVNADSLSEFLSETEPLVNSIIFQAARKENRHFFKKDRWTHPQELGLKSSKASEIPSWDVPNVDINEDLIKFYQRAKSTNDPANTFLSYYHILEYFFLKVSEKDLHERIKQRINEYILEGVGDPLEKIVGDVEQFKGRIDETEMLRRVLDRFVRPDELMDFLERNQEEYEDNHYTGETEVFGKDSPIRLEEGHVISNIAKRVKLIRNSIVHSSDRQERSETFVPLTRPHEDLIDREIPLLRYLAERVIIGSATPRTET